METFDEAMYRTNMMQDLDVLLKHMTTHVIIIETNMIDQSRFVRSSKLVDSLSFLQSKDRIHKNRKPSNILINQNLEVFKLCN